ncbi:hypothetical protein ABBQ32_010289 [Trebouxia sp. C0010 RCD-2024]
MGTAPELQEVLPKAGLVVSEKGQLSEVLCKPKILPLKSVSLEKIEQMEARVQKFNDKALAVNPPSIPQQ